MLEESRADTGLPDLAAVAAADGAICNQCGHPAILSPRRPSLLRRLVGMKPRPAECQVEEYDYSGLAALPCGCRAAAHGS